MSSKLLAEFFGTFWLVLGGCGSAVLAAGVADVGIGWLGVALAFGLTVMTMAFAVGHISGGHFNPAVTLAFAIRREAPVSEAAAYMLAQIAGGLAGSIVAHAMFDLDLIQISQTARTGGPQWTAEIVATFGLVGTILAGIRFRADAVPWLVGLYINAAYWFTASTAFANPAVAIGRAISDTFAGIRPGDVPGFIMAQLVGSILAVLFFGWLLQKPPRD